MNDSRFLRPPCLRGCDVLVVCVAMETDRGGRIYALAAHGVVARSRAPILLDGFSWRGRSHPPREADPADPFSDEPLVPVASDVSRRDDDGSAREVVSAMEGWLSAIRREPGEATVLGGFAAVQDFWSLSRAYDSAGAEFPFSSSVLELRSLAMGALGLSWDMASPDRVARLLSMDPAPRGDPVDEEARLGARITSTLLDKIRKRAVVDALM